MENYLALKDAGISIRCLKNCSATMIEVDLLGQANSESVGLNVVNGVGGMMDFVRGAISSEGGKAVEMSLM